MFILVQVYGLDAQTDCMGHLTHADFDKQDEHPEHPKQYKPNDISAVLIRFGVIAIQKQMSPTFTLLPHLGDRVSPQHNLV